MDACGLLYGSSEFLDECLFKETIGHDHYNSYASIKHSNDKHTLYLALNSQGQSRRIMLKTNRTLGKLAAYTRVLTRPASQFIEHPVRHHGHHCLQRTAAVHPTQHRPAGSGRCQLKQKKKKKKKRKCTADNPCSKKQFAGRKKKCEENNGEKCQRVTNGGNRKKPKKLSDNNNRQAKNKKKLTKGRLPNKNSKKARSTTTEVPAPTTTQDPLDEDYYGFENTTHWDWEESSTANPDESSTTTVHPD